MPRTNADEAVVIEVDETDIAEAAMQKRWGDFCGNTGQSVLSGHEPVIGVGQADLPIQMALYIENVYRRIAKIGTFAQ